MAKVSTVASLIAWEEARRHIAKTFGLPGYGGNDWPEKIGINELAALQTIDCPKDLDAWQTALLNSNIPVTIEEYERRYQYNVPGKIFEHKVISGNDFAVYLDEQNEKPSRLVAAWFEAFGIDAADTGRDARAVTVMQTEALKPWLVVDPRDPVAKLNWYIPARYFARQLVIEDSTLLTKRVLLANKVAKSLDKVGIKKRGGIKPFDRATVLKAFSNVDLG